MDPILIFIGLILVGIGMYASNIVLLRYYIDLHDPKILEDDTILPSGEYLWEQTAGMGIVPIWVSLLGVLCYPVALVGVIGVIWYVLT